MTTQTVGDRLAALVTAPPYSMTLKGFAAEIGVTYETLRKWRRGRAAPTEKNLSAIIVVLGQSVTREWVMYGAGNPPHSAGESPQDSETNAVVAAAIPLLLWAEANLVALDNDDLALSQAPRVASARPATRRGKRIEVPDNSMFPTLMEGDAVELEPDERPSPGDIVLVRDRDGRHYLREYRERPYGFDAYPHNPIFATLESERDGLTVEAVGTHYLRPLRRKS